MTTNRVKENVNIPAEPTSWRKRHDLAFGLNYKCETMKMSSRDNEDIVVYIKNIFE